MVSERKKLKAVTIENEKKTRISKSSTNFWIKE